MAKKSEKACIESIILIKSQQQIQKPQTRNIACINKCCKTRHDSMENQITTTMQHAIPQ